MKYSEKKAAQIAAFFIFRAGGTIEILKLMKLMYLAERESLARYGEPLTGDSLFSMTHGPVMSLTYDHINNVIDSEPGGWESWIKDRENHILALKQEGDPCPKLTQLSDADFEILEYIQNEFGYMTGKQLRDYTHDKCAEWEDPDNSSAPIPYSRVLRCVGHTPEIARELEERIKTQSRLDLIFESAGK